MNPVDGFKKILSLKALVEGFKAILKLAVIMTLAYFLLREQIHQLPQLMGYSIAQLMAFVGTLTTRLLFGVGLFMLGLATLDYMYQRWDLESQMRMTKQEVKEEVKSREGDPMIRARIKRIQREMSSRRMMDEVPKANVVVTNPTHIAVALKYDDTMVAPTIVAMGADHVAEKIKEVARNAGVPLVENVPLARAMFKSMKIGQSIPRELYTAVAEVLSYVFRLKKKARR
jgi:flagellar biosynthetic protein FlhB